MELTTKIDLPKLDLRIDHAKSGMMLGSCFADSISELMLSAKFNVTKNPFGVLYNPFSIAASLMRLDSAQEFTAAELCRRDDLWFSFAHHGSFSSTEADRALDNINSALNAGAAALKSVDYVVITFGTSWIYRNRATGNVVANCHKLPSSEFVRERLTVEDITTLYKPLLEGVLKSKHVLFTVSPIRHIKDGLRQNSISKATLLLAIDTLTNAYDNAEYFPSYEIMMDELRDYRFYKEDMLHPTDQAVEYIWTLFQQSAMDRPTQELISQIVQLNRAASHRPFNPDSESHAKFRSHMLSVTEKLQAHNPSIDFSNELNYFKR